MSRRLSSLMAAVSIASAGCLSDVNGLPSLASQQSRLGRLTYDDAVRQMGPPARKETLGDNSVVAEWEAGTERGPSFSFGLGSSSGNVSEGTGTTVAGRVVHRVRQLQFDQAGKLAAVKELRR